MPGGREIAERLGCVGVWSFALQARPAAEERAFVAEVERLGYGAVWVPESVGSKEVFAHASLLLAGGQRIAVASGIANIWARDPMAMAAGARTLDEAFGGRFLLGIGVSHAPSVAARGHAYDRPLQRMRDYLDAMDGAAWAGPTRAGRPARVLAALGPGMLELAGERAEGAHTYFVPVEHTPTARQRLGPDPLLAVEQAAVLDPDAEAARRIARAYADRYLRSENYARNLQRLGWDERDLAGGGSDALIDAVIVHGDAGAIVERTQAHLDAGADHVCLQVLAADPSDPALERLAELAPVVLGLDSGSPPPPG